MKKNVPSIRFSTLLNGSNNYPPKVRDLLKRYGSDSIQSLTLMRTPVSEVLSQGLSALSLGKFGDRLQDQPYDKLFHLFLEISTTSGNRLSLEKNERINMDLNPAKRPQTESKGVNGLHSGSITINQLLDKTKAKLGSQFFSYDAVNNNCQDFLLAVLTANGIGSQVDYDFIKQDTKQLFEGLPALKKFAHFATEVAERANIVTQGGKISTRSDIRNYSEILNHLVSHITDPKEPIDKRDFSQANKLISIIKQLKKGVVGGGLGNKSVVQSVVFSKRLWNTARAKKWLKKEGYSGLEVDIKPHTLRFRQLNPNQFKSFRVKELTGGVSLVLAFKKTMRGGGGGYSKPASRSSNTTVNRNTTVVAGNSTITDHPVSFLYDVPNNETARLERRDAAHNFYEMMERYPDRTIYGLPMEDLAPAIDILLGLNGGEVIEIPQSKQLFFDAAKLALTTGQPIPTYDENRQVVTTYYPRQSYIPIRSEGDAEADEYDETDRDFFVNR